MEGRVGKPFFHPSLCFSFAFVCVFRRGKDTRLHRNDKIKCQQIRHRYFVLFLDFIIQ